MKNEIKTVLLQLTPHGSRDISIVNLGNIESINEHDPGSKIVFSSGIVGFFEESIAQISHALNGADGVNYLGKENFTNGPRFI